MFCRKVLHSLMARKERGIFLKIGEKSPRQEISKGDRGIQEDVFCVLVRQVLKKGSWGYQKRKSLRTIGLERYFVS